MYEAYSGVWGNSNFFIFFVFGRNCRVFLFSFIFRPENEIAFSVLFIFRPKKGKSFDGGPLVGSLYQK